MISRYINFLFYSILLGFKSGSVQIRWQDTYIHMQRSIAFEPRRNPHMVSA